MLFRVVFVDFISNFLHFLLKLGYFGNTFLELKIKYFPIIKSIFHENAEKNLYSDTYF